MSKNAGLNRRSFMKNAGFTALAGATGSLAVGASQANAQSGSPSQSYPRHANGNYDFGTVYNRAGHNCARWDSPPRNYPGGEFKFGMVFASMDFECAPCITEALMERVQHHSWGYLASTAELTSEIVKWNGEHHNNDIDASMVTLSDGVYPGMIAAMRSFAARRQGVDYVSCLLRVLYHGRCGKH